MKTYIKAVLFAGVILPIILHMIASDRMPWWPDTASFGIAAGAVAASLVWKARVDREWNPRIWNVIKTVAGRSRSH